MKRRYDGPAIDGTVQHITERPVQPGREEGETVAATDAPDGEVTAENVPYADDGGIDRPAAGEQTTWSDWNDHA